MCIALIMKVGRPTVLYNVGRVIKCDIEVYFTETKCDLLCDSCWRDLSNLGKLSVDDRRHAVISQLRACFGTSAFNYLHVTARIRV